MHKYTWKTPEVADSNLVGYGIEDIDFFYNSDLSGKVIIINDAGQSFEVPGHALLAFTAYCYVRRNKISALEDMDWKQLLKE